MITLAFYVTEATISPVMDHNIDPIFLIKLFWKVPTSTEEFLVLSLSSRQSFHQSRFSIQFHRVILIDEDINTKMFPSKEVFISDSDSSFQLPHIASSTIQMSER